MRLSHAEIWNFRSIKHAKINFQPSCRVLVGVNESGKSNVLKALALLDPERNPKPEDVREFGFDEDYKENARVVFTFILDQNEQKELQKSLSERILGKNDEAIFSVGTKQISLNEFLQGGITAQQTVDIRTGRRSANLTTPYATAKLLPHWKTPTENSEFEIPMASPAEGQSLTDFYLVDSNIYSDIAAQECKDTEIFTFWKLIRNVLDDMMAESAPEVVFWEYTEASLLPATLVLDTFAKTPSSCQPMRQIFRLAGYDNILETVAAARLRPNGIRNLLRRLSDRATKHLRRVWRDHRGVQIVLNENGASVTATILEDENQFDFNRRSDGFKRFLSFLLMISAQAETKEMRNALYLHDEPDTSLHPTGARFLRDELFRIAEDNLVVYSTHSIFMVDRDNIARHLLVEKKGEITHVKQPEKSAVLEEEVLYNALNWSVFDVLKKHNLIFEGWRDKRLFDVALNKPPQVYKKLVDGFNKTGACFAHGVSDIARVAAVLELADRAWVIVSDADKAARNQQREYHGKGAWLRYDELGASAITGEDFLKPDYFVEVINEVLARNERHERMEKGYFSKVSGGRIDMLKNWLHQQGINAELGKTLIQTAKDQSFSALQANHISAEYFEMLKTLLSRI